MRHTEDARLSRKPQSWSINCTKEIKTYGINVRIRVGDLSKYLIIKYKYQFGHLGEDIGEAVYIIFCGVSSLNSNMSSIENKTPSMQDDQL